jgi:1-deoxy-D-xylulose-5-phosphate synthase
MREIPIGKAELVRSGIHVAILSFGTLLPAAQQAGEVLSASVVNMRFVKPLDEELIIEIAATHDLIVTLEENVVAGGAGSAVNEFIATTNFNTPILNLGIPDQHINQASQQEQLASCGLDVDGIIKSISSSPYYQAEYKQTEKKSTTA